MSKTLNFLNINAEEQYSIAKIALTNEIANLEQLRDIKFAQYVPQHYVGYTDLSVANHTMVTIGLGPCVGLGIYNPTTHKAVLVHLDDVTTTTSIMELVDKISQGNEGTLQIAVTGGNKMSEEFLSPIVGYLERIPNSKIIINESFPLSKDKYGQKLSVDAQGNFLTEKNIDTQIIYKSIHPFKSPEIHNIVKKTNENDEYDLVTIDFADPYHQPIVELVDYHPIFNEECVA